MLNLFSDKVEIIEGIKVISPFWDMTLKSMMACAGTTADGEEAVWIDRDFQKQLSAEQYKFVVYHELGHIKNGDLKKGRLHLLVNHLRVEKAADAYAVNKGLSPKDGVAALRKTAEYALAGNPRNLLQRGFRYLALLELNARINALEAMV